jgi:hypothetical protein
LIIEQTIPKVIELLSEVEDIMNEATDSSPRRRPAVKPSPPKPKSSRKSTPPPRNAKARAALANPVAP